MPSSTASSSSGYWYDFYADVFKHFQPVEWREKKLGREGRGVVLAAEMDAMTDHLFFTSEGREDQLRYEAMIHRQLKSW
jgi:hypothetical protein